MAPHTPRLENMGQQYESESQNVAIVGSTDDYLIIAGSGKCSCEISEIVVSILICGARSQSIDF